ncbi:MAG: DUF3048 domain-containing protein [Microthrixaceae bacterium]
MRSDRRGCSIVEFERRGHHGRRATRDSPDHVVRHGPDHHDHHDHHDTDAGRRVRPAHGEPVDAATLARLARPPLALKIDNHPAAMPQAGLNQADVVFEIAVEGVSRFLSVYHSTDANPVGPVRSARHSDPPILALLGTPLFGWSGANDDVARDVYGSSWITDVNWDRVARSAYRRRSVHRAPHNLYTGTSALFAYARTTQRGASPLFGVMAASEANAGEVPLGRVRLSVGGTTSSWEWAPAAEPGAGRYLRSQYGRRHLLEGGDQVSAANVVILEIRYSGTRTNPTAITQGSGRALVLSGGKAIEGRWSRPNQLLGLSLTGPTGQPIMLRPGRTWVELTRGHTFVAA